MSKFGIGVGEDFPLDENNGQPGRHRRGRGRHHRHHFHGGHHGPHPGPHHGAHHGHGHHLHHGGGRLAILLVVAGLAALIVEHKLTAGWSYGLIGVGAALIAARIAAHLLWHRRLARQVAAPSTGAV